MDLIKKIGNVVDLVGVVGNASSGTGLFSIFGKAFNSFFISPQVKDLPDKVIKVMLNSPKAEGLTALINEIANRLSAQLLLLMKLILHSRRRIIVWNRKLLSLFSLK